jgi:lysophospholipase L1-like esterase
MKRLALMIMLSCTPRPAPSPAAAQDSAAASAAETGASQDKVHFVGRFDPSRAFSFAGSTVMARFSGTGIQADLETSGHDFFTVAIDGGEPKRIQPAAGRSKQILASGLSNGTHDVALAKATEAFVGIAKFYGFEVTGGELVTSPFPFARRIEIVGDSISNGYGVNGPNGRCPFTPDTESEWDAWGAIAARQLKAAHTTIAYSGRGVVRNSNGSTTDTMQSIFGRTLADSPDPKWDFATWKPDVVAVNLGTNDFAQGDPGPTFIDGYYGLLRAIRERYADASIVCALGTMLDPMEIGKARAYVNEAIKRMNDPRISYLELGHPEKDDGLGCDRHPSAKTQQRMGLALAAHLRERMKW